MTNRERLIYLMIEAKRTDPETGSFTEYLADYLLEHGVIVLPCKVGDTLYCESAIKGHITYLKAPDLEWIFENREIFGKEIFLTREEAERALKEREKEWTEQKK